MQSLLVYFITFSISILFAFLFDIQSKKSKSDLFIIQNGNNILVNLAYFKYLLFFVGIFLLPVLITGFRYQVGTDYNNYYILYNILKEANLAELMRQTQFNEPLYVFFNKIAGIIFLGHDLGIFFLTSITIFYLISKTNIYISNKYETSFLYTLFIFYMYFFPLTFNIQRQMIAVSIVLYAITKLLEKKYISYIILILIAMGFHTSAVLAIFFIPIAILVKHEKFISIILLASSFFIGFLFKFFSKIPFFAKYLYRYQIVDGNISIATLFEILFFIVPLFINKKIILNKYPELKPLFPISLVSVPLLFFSSFQHWFGRTIYFVTILQIFLIPLIIKVQEKKSKKQYYILFFALYYLGYFVLKFYIVGTEEIFPYQTKNITFS